MHWSEDEEEKENQSDEEKQDNKEDKDDKKSDEDEESDSDSRKIRTPKEKIIELIKDKYLSIKTGIKNSTLKKVLESFDELQKNNDKINSIFKRDEIPAYYYECFALIDDLLNMSKEDQKNLSKDNNASFNTLKKVHVRIVKKIGTNLTEYKKKEKQKLNWKRTSPISSKNRKKKEKNPTMMTSIFSN